METTLITTIGLLAIITFLQNRSIHLLTKENKEMMALIDKQYQDNEPLLEYCLQDILNNAIRNENYAEAARCRNIMNELKKIKK